MRHQLILFFLLFFFIDLQAQTIGGGEIYYQQVSNKKYKITANVYRRCNDSALYGITGFVISDTFKVGLNFKRVSISRINDTCGNPCNIVNAVSNPGFEKHVFIDTVDFTKQPYNKIVASGNCIVRFSIQQNIRSSSVTTLKSIGSNDTFYMDAMVNICLKLEKNRSPEFTFEPKFLACCMQPFIYNMGIADSSDVDSLSLSLAPALTDVFVPVKYEGSFSENYPMTPYCPPNPGVLNCAPKPNVKPPRGFYFDKETGDITFLPYKCFEVGIIKVLVSEYRKDSSNKFVLLGQVSREMLVETKQCQDNNPPYFIGASKFGVCENNKICFNMDAKDEPYLPYQKTPDTLSLSWNHAIRGATCKIVDSNAREKSLTFCWIPKPSQSITYNRFGIIAYDKQCNIGMSAKGFLITTKPLANTIRDFKISNCNRLEYTFIPVDTLNTQAKDYVYTVTISSLDNPTNILFTSFKGRDSFQAPKKGKYLIKGWTNNKNFNCGLNTVDTVSLDAPVAVICYSRDSFFCQYDSIHLSPINNDFSPFRFKWYDSEIGEHVADTSMVYRTRLNGLSKRVWVEIKDDKACTYRDTVNLVSRGAFEMTPKGHALTLCSGIQDTVRINKFKGTAPFTIEWFADGMYIGSDSAQVVKLSKTSTLTVQVRDSANCPAEDTINAKVIRMPVIHMADTIICLHQDAIIAANLSSNNSTLKYRWTLNNKVTSQTSDKFSFKVNGSYSLNLMVYTSDACKTEKTVFIDFFPLPNFRIVGDSVYNKANFIKLSTDKPFEAYKWSNGASLRENNFWAYTLGTPGAYTMSLEVTDSNGCNNTQNIYFRTNGFTGISKISDSEVTVYPNPASEQIVMACKYDTRYRILSFEGREVLSGMLTAGEQTIPITNLSKGIYFIETQGLVLQFVKL
jgi:hypothetical protein